MIAEGVSQIPMFPFIYPNPFDVLRSQDPKSETAHQQLIVAPAEHFHVSLDLKQFRREEITIKFIDDTTIRVEAEHEDKPDDEGGVYRHIVRNYTVPGGYEIQKLMSKLSRDGVLSITAKKVAQEEMPVPPKLEEASDENDNFLLTLDLHHFKPNEIDVRFISKNTISVEAQHRGEDRAHRRFVQKYVVPDGYDVEKVMTKLSDGIISITGPRISNGANDNRKKEFSEQCKYKKANVGENEMEMKRATTVVTFNFEGCV